MLTQTYRPQTFDQVIGQKNVVVSLKNTIKTNKIHSSYLFAGPSGTGKTSVARVLAKSLNCKTRGDNYNPCLDCDSCTAIAQNRYLDLSELDCASQGGIDDIRDLIQSANNYPMAGKYKIYILDECHNMSDKAMQVLLKTLEDLRDTTKFIFCTTEAHKLNKAFTQRCMTFLFNPVDDLDINQHLTAINKSDSLGLKPETLQVITQASQGCLRIAVTLLEKVSLNPESSEEEIYSILNKPAPVNTINLLNSISSKKVIGIYTELKEMNRAGINPLDILSEISNLVRNALVYQQDSKAFKLMTTDTTTFKSVGAWGKQHSTDHLIQSVILLRKAEIDFASSKNPKLFLEATLLEMSQIFSQQSLIDSSPATKPDVKIEAIWKRIECHPGMEKLKAHITGRAIDQNLITVSLRPELAHLSEKAETILTDVCKDLKFNFKVKVLSA